MVEKFNEADMKNIIQGLNEFLKTELNNQTESDGAELCSLNDESGYFVLSARKSSVYEIYLRFNRDYKNDYGYHKTLVISVLTFKDNADVMESKFLIKLADIIKKYGYEYIVYEAITTRMRTFAINCKISLNMDTHSNSRGHHYH